MEGGGSSWRDKMKRLLLWPCSPHQTIEPPRWLPEQHFCQNNSTPRSSADKERDTMPGNQIHSSQTSKTRKPSNPFNNRGNLYFSRVFYRHNLMWGRSYRQVCEKDEKEEKVQLTASSTLTGLSYVLLYWQIRRCRDMLLHACDQSKTAATVL